MYFVFNRKINNIFMKNFIKFFQNLRNFGQKFRKKSTNSLYFLETLKLDISVKNENQKNLYNSIFYGGQAF